MNPALAVLSAWPDDAKAVFWIGVALCAYFVLVLGTLEFRHQMITRRQRKGRRPGNIMDAQGDARLPR